MNQILEPISCLTPVRRRALLAAAPVLIRVPVLAGASVGGVRPSSRRRLRREVRAAGYWLLALIPATVACATWGGHRPPVLLTVNPPARPALAVRARGDDRPSLISLSLAPIVATQPSHEFAGGPVFLSGQLLPADPSEESAHGGY